MNRPACPFCTLPPERVFLETGTTLAFLDAYPVAEGHAILDRLVDQDFPCYGLTNWSGETYRAAQDLMPFVRHMQYTAVSGDLKMGKPEPEIFRHLLGVIGKPAEACAFIDDSPANIAAAKRLGIHAVLFKNDGSATEELRKLGVPV